MRFAKKLFITLLVIAILGGAFYFIFNRPEESGASRNPFSDLFSRSRENTAENRIFLDPKRFIDGKVSSIKENIEEKGSGILGFLKEGTGEAIDAIGEKIGIEDSTSTKTKTVSGGGSIRVLPVAKAGAKAYFLISNPEPAEQVEYEIDWGDGSVEKGVLSGENKTVSHEWAKEGEFFVNFKTLDSGSVSESIRVFVTN